MEENRIVEIKCARIVKPLDEERMREGYDFLVRVYRHLSYEDGRDVLERMGSLMRESKKKGIVLD
jgi:hypothetical protein